MLVSDYRALADVSLPFAGRQMYMHTFDIAAPVMAHGYEDYLAPVTRLLESAGALSGLAHMTVDEKISRMRAPAELFLTVVLLQGAPGRFAGKSEAAGMLDSHGMYVALTYDRTGGGLCH